MLRQQLSNTAQTRIWPEATEQHVYPLAMTRHSMINITEENAWPKSSRPVSPTVTMHGNDVKFVPANQNLNDDNDNFTLLQINEG